MICPLCASARSTLYAEDKLRSYFQCDRCSLVFVPREQLISQGDEKKRYDSHENSAVDEAYREYLQKVSAQVIPLVPDEARGLDYGCGRTEVFAGLFPPSVLMESYDLYYFPRTDLLKKSYNFITMIEVIEHLRKPADELQQLNSMLLPEGRLFIKTKFLPEKEKFRDWFYKRDMTHIQFFSRESMTFICEAFGFREVKFLSEDVTVLFNH